MKIGIYNFRLKLKDDVTFGSLCTATIRGALGYSLRKLVCFQKQSECYNCIIKEECIYSYIFETPHPSYVQKLRKYSRVVHPFRLYSDLSKRKFSAGEEFNIELVLFGKAIQRLSFIIQAFIKASQRGLTYKKSKFDIIEVYVKDFRNCKKVIFTGADGKILPHELPDYRLDSVIEERAKIQKKVRIKFLSPYRFRRNNRLSDDIDFYVIVRSIISRFSSLAFFHADEDYNLDYKSLLEEARKVQLIENNTYWYDCTRYSTRQKTRMKFGGLMGSVVFLINDIMWFNILKLGEIFAIGKNTSFGLGKMEVENV